MFRWNIRFFCTVIFFCFADGRRFPAGTGGSTGYGKQSHRNHPIYRRRANHRQTAGAGQTGDTRQTAGKPAAGRNKTKQRNFCILVFCIKNGYSRRNTRHRPETQTVIVLQNRYRHRQILLQQPLLPKQTLPYKYRESQTVCCYSPLCYISVGNYPYYRNYTVSRPNP